MKRKKISMFLAVPLLALYLGACSQEPAETATASDTAVHDAEVAVATAGELMAKGQGVYNANCAACHQPNGQGLAGAFPPLAGSDYLAGNREDVISTALFGLTGPITVNGVDYNGVMPSLGHLPDEDLAAAITYVFGSWGNDLAAVSVAEVAAIRAAAGAAGHGCQRPGSHRSRVCNGNAALLRAMRGMPWCVAQRRHGQAADAGHYPGKGYRLPESPDHLRLACRHAQLGYRG
jgi:mono/diheme cytochrome c family protein